MSASTPLTGAPYTEVIRALLVRVGFPLERCSLFEDEGRTTPDLLAIDDERDFDGEVAGHTRGWGAGDRGGEDVFDALSFWWQEERSGVDRDCVQGNRAPASGDDSTDALAPTDLVGVVGDGRLHDQSEVSRERDTEASYDGASTPTGGLVDVSEQPDIEGTHGAHGSTGSAA